MKNDNRADIDLFNNYSEFALTEDELLAIHGGATNSGSVSSSDSSSSAAASAPPPAPPQPPQSGGAPVADHTSHVTTMVEAGGMAGAGAGFVLGGPPGAIAGGTIGTIAGLGAGIAVEFNEHFPEAVEEYKNNPPPI
jgi:hypothetical protein